MTLIIWTVPFVVALIAGLFIGGIAQPLLMIGLLAFVVWQSLDMTRGNLRLRSHSWGRWLVVASSILQMAAVVVGSVIVFLDLVDFGPAVVLTYLATVLMFFLVFPAMWWDTTFREETGIAEEMLASRK